MTKLATRNMSYTVATKATRNWTNYTMIDAIPTYIINEENL